MEVDPTPTSSDPKGNGNAFKIPVRSTILNLKTPLLRPDGKRQDSREPSEIRSLCKSYIVTLCKIEICTHADLLINSMLCLYSLVFDSGVRTGCKGSSYVEMGNTKIMCIVHGPKDLPKKVEYR